MAAGVGLVLLVWLLHRHILTHGPAPGDGWAAVHFAHPRTQPRPLQDLTGFFAALGTPAIATALTAALAFWLLARERLHELIGLVSAASVVAATAAMKLHWGPTPLWVATGHGLGANFPSGHTAYATALFGYLGMLGYRHRRPELVVLALALVAGMGPARVISGNHLPSDVIGGYLLGSAWLLVASCWLRPAPRRAHASPEPDRRRRLGPQPVDPEPPTVEEPG